MSWLSLSEFFCVYSIYPVQIHCLNTGPIQIYEILNTGNFQRVVLTIYIDFKMVCNYLNAAVLWSNTIIVLRIYSNALSLFLLYKCRSPIYSIRRI